MVKPQDVDEVPFMEEMQRLQMSGFRVQLDLRAVNAFSLLAHLQLALRHPRRNGNPSANRVRMIAVAIQSRLCLTETLKRVANRGWNPNEDVPC